MKRPFSLERRLVAGLTLGITLLWLIAAIIAGRVVQHELDEALDSAMAETAQRILPLAVLDIVERDGATGPQRIAPLSAHAEHFTYVVRAASGKIVLQSHAADPALFRARPTEGFASSATHRLYATGALRGTLFIEIAESLAYRRHAASESVAALLLPLSGLIPLSVAGIWLFVHLSLRSVQSYRRAIEQRGAGDLSPIAAGQLPAEIAPLARAVNRLLERLRSALEAERSFTANSAHELRTPIAVALAQLQRLRGDAAAGPVQARISQVEASLRDLARLSEKLMQLAKAEGGGLVSDTPHDLVRLLDLVVQDLRRGSAAQIEVATPDSGQLCLAIDPDAFAILLRNLIENALKHGPAGQPVQVRLGADARLTVTNAGPVVPAPLLSRLTERFARGDSRAEGAGLGLSIATAIAHGVGATLTLASPASGRSDGFEAAVQFANNA